MVKLSLHNGKGVLSLTTAHHRMVKTVMLKMILINRSDHPKKCVFKTTVLLTIRLLTIM